MATRSSESTSHLLMNEIETQGLQAQKMVRVDSGFEQDCSVDPARKIQKSATPRRLSGGSDAGTNKTGSAVRSHTEMRSRSRIPVHKTSSKTLGRPDSSRSSPQSPPLSLVGKRGIPRSSTAISDVLPRRLTINDRSLAPHPSRISTAPVPQVRQAWAQDPLALHHRSCSLFPAASNPTSPRPPNTTPRCSSPSANDLTTWQSNPASVIITPTVSQDGENTRLLDQAAPTSDVIIPPSVIHWTSPSTRRREYAEIDNRYRGFRGLCRRLAPKWCSKSAAAAASYRFYDGKNEADNCSVRRYRLDLPEDDGDDEAQREPVTVLDEKQAIREAPRKTWGCLRRRGLRRLW